MNLKVLNNKTFKKIFPIKWTVILNLITKTIILHFNSYNIKQNPRRFMKKMKLNQKAKKKYYLIHSQMKRKLINKKLKKTKNKIQKIHTKKTIMKCWIKQS